MNQNIWKKGLVVIIILLFLGAGNIPAISKNQTNVLIEDSYEKSLRNIYTFNLSDWQQIIVNKSDMKTLNPVGSTFTIEPPFSLGSEGTYVESTIPGCATAVISHDKTTGKIYGRSQVCSCDYHNSGEAWAYAIIGQGVNVLKDININSLSFDGFCKYVYLAPENGFSGGVKIEYKIFGEDGLLDSKILYLKDLTHKQITPKNYGPENFDYEDNVDISFKKGDYFTLIIEVTLVTFSNGEPNHGCGIIAMNNDDSNLKFEIDKMTISFESSNEPPVLWFWGGTPDLNVINPTGIYHCGGYDPDGNIVHAMIDYDGDGLVQSWVDNNETFETKHTFPSTESIWNVEFWLVDQDGAESNHENLEVTVPKGKLYFNNPLLKFLDNNPNLFPLLQRFLGIFLIHNEK